MIRTKFTLKQLEAFVTVVETGSFRRAASKLGTTQPNISNRISSLEDCVGSVLMYRDAGSVRLTDIGITLLKDARNILRGAESFLESAGRHDLIEERLRLGVTELVAMTWLQPFLRELRATYPALSITLEVNLAVEIDKQLRANQIDLALQSGPFARKVSAEIPLGQFPYIWAATPKIAGSLPRSPKLSDLFSAGIISHAKHTEAGKALSSACDQFDLPEDKVIHSSSLSCCVPMAVDGMGVALLPELALRTAIQTGSLVQVPCDWRPPDLEFSARFEKSHQAKFVAKAAEIAERIAAPQTDNKIQSY